MAGTYVARSGLDMDSKRNGPATSPAITPRTNGADIRRSHRSQIAGTTGTGSRNHGRVNGDGSDAAIKATNSESSPPRRRAASKADTTRGCAHGVHREENDDVEGTGTFNAKAENEVGNRDASSHSRALPALGRQSAVHARCGHDGVAGAFFWRRAELGARCASRHALEQAPPDATDVAGPYRLNDGQRFGHNADCSRLGDGVTADKVGSPLEHATVFWQGAAGRMLPTDLSGAVVRVF